MPSCLRLTPPWRILVAPMLGISLAWTAGCQTSSPSAIHTPIQSSPPSTPSTPAGKAIDGSEDTDPSAMPTAAAPSSPKTPGNTLPGAGGFGTRPVPKNLTREQLNKVADRPQEHPGYRSLSFIDLGGFPFRLDDKGRTSDTIPAAVQALDGQSVAVSGYMVPLGLTMEGVSDFILVKNQMLCCYGQTPQLNEWMVVRCSKPHKAIVEVPIAVLGKMKVGPNLVGGQIANIYSLQADQIEEMR